jgi:hypothetical protein
MTRARQILPRILRRILPRLLPRLGLVVAVAAIAALCLSSSLFAALVAVATAAFVAIDTLAWRDVGPPVEHARALHPEPLTVEIDLSRPRP